MASDTERSNSARSNETPKRRVNPKVAIDSDLLRPPPKRTPPKRPPGIPLIVRKRFLS